jgi:UDP-glucose 4-epimerase
LKMSDDSRQKILVTGGSGYIGSHAVVALIAAGYDPVIVDNLSNSKVAVLERIAAITGQRPLFYCLDLRDRPGCNAIFQENAFSAVIHFAGLKAVGESVAQPLRYYENNIEGTLSLCSLMADHGVKRLIFSSSATVYGEPATVPIREDFPLAPASPYGRTKLMIEQILQDFYVADPAWQVALLRYFNPVAAHESGLIGEDPSGTPNNLLPCISQVAVGRRERLNIFGSDYPTHDGTGVRDYIHVMDLAEGHVAALRYMEETMLSFPQKESTSSLSLPYRQESREELKRLDSRLRGNDIKDGVAVDSCLLYGCPTENLGHDNNDGDALDSRLHGNDIGRSAPLIVNLGTGQGYSVLEILHAFEKVSGRKVPYQLVNRRPGDIATCYADPTRAKELLNWSARRNLADMCTDTWRWQEKNPEGYNF